jgi:RpiB/LacA/LacB family sugar-phosphate isomerase
MNVGCGYFRDMTISIGCDHAGPALKARIAQHLEAQGHITLNRGTDSEDSVDYPDHAHAVADDVSNEAAQLGVLICGSANGVAMTANKHPEIRAAIAWTPEVAALARQHNDANVLCIPARFVSEETALAMVDAFFQSEFEGGRHQRRVGKIACAMLASFALVLSGWAQRPGLTDPGYVNSVKLDEKQLRVHLSILASDGFEGRETGEVGQRKAAAYLEAYYASLGFEGCNDGSYFQMVPMTNTQIRGGAVVVGEDTLELAEEFLLYPGLEVTELTNEKLTFVGHGIQTDSWNDYKKYKGGGVVLMRSGEPVDATGRSLLTESGEPSEWSESANMKRELAQEMGAKAVVMVLSDEDFEMRKSRMKRWMLRKSTSLNREKEGEGTNLPTLFVSESQANRWLVGSKAGSLSEHNSALSKGKPAKAEELASMFNMNIDQLRYSFEAENVLAFLEGSDEELKDEVIVVTSHYDHVGIIDGEIHNGADDDGSGTVTVMELARQFTNMVDRGLRPRRSVLFMNVVGEEKGLLGSEWYADHPVFPLENTVANLNIDMIGRTDEAHSDDPRYVYLIGSDKLSSELHEVSEYCNDTYTKLALDYTYNAPDDPNRFYYRSDHYNFAKNNIPVIFYFTGVHEDYHKPGDDAEKILYPKMAEIGKLVFHTAWHLANMDNRIVVDRVNDFPSDR